MSVSYLLFKLSWQRKVSEEMVVIMFGLLFMENKFCASIIFLFCKDRRLKVGNMSSIVACDWYWVLGSVRMPKTHL